MNPYGKKAKLRAKTRKQWIKENPPSHEGYYICGICQGWVLAKEMVLDHILPSSHRPDLLDNLDNLQPTHATCNAQKGSVH